MYVLPIVGRQQRKSMSEKGPIRERASRTDA